MRSATTSLALLRPRSMDEALRLLRDDPPLVPIAGCTDIYVGLNFGTVRDMRFLDLWGLEPLRQIEMRGDMLSIGAVATYTQILKSTLVRQRLPILASAAREIGGPQIQNRGTLGGNIANGSPAGDTLPVLAVADAVIVLRSEGDERRIPMERFYTGYRTSVRRPDELIVAVEIPPIDGTQWFRKVGTRAAQAISKIVMAGVRASAPRIALGSVAATVIRLPRTEASLASGASLDEAARVMGEEITPIDDVRSTAAYRRQVATNLLRRFWGDTAALA